MENVKMKDIWEHEINMKMGVQPLRINSNLLSAQNRKRLYWTNIKDVTIPNDKNILLEDIICITDDNNILTSEQILSIKRYKSASSTLRMVGDFEYKYKQGAVQFPNNLKGKSQCILASKQKRSETYVQIPTGIRPLSSMELEIAQTIPIAYTEFGDYDGVIKKLSDNKRHFLIGNSFTVEVIKHILSHHKFIYND